jgi:two-component SAPR family response regulator
MDQDQKDTIEAIAKGSTAGALGSLLDIFKRKKKPIKEAPTIEDIKKHTKILFIDDEDFEYATVLMSAGWNISQIKEVEDLDADIVKRADIIFLDYLGVGNILTPQEKGLGLLDAIKKKFPDKIVIFFSAHTGFGLDKKLKLADDWVAKSSDAIVYIQKIEEWSRKIYK